MSAASTSRPWAATASTPPGIRCAVGSDGTMSRLICAVPRSPMSLRISPRAGVRSPASPSSSRRGRRRSAPTRCRSCAPSPKRSTTSSRTATFASSSPIREEPSASAQKLVYLESQFLWSPELVKILAAKLRDPPHDDFRLVVLLPASPNNGSDSTRGQLGVLAEADGGNQPLSLPRRASARSGGLAVAALRTRGGSPSSTTRGSRSDRREPQRDHSLSTTQEMNVVTCDRELARETRLRLWSEHLPKAHWPRPPATRTA